MLWALLFAIGLVVSLATALDGLPGMLRRELRRPRRRLLDTRYHRIDGYRIGVGNVVGLSTGPVELTWDVLETVGMPDSTRRPVHGPL